MSGGTRQTNSRRLSATEKGKKPLVEDLKWNHPTVMKTSGHGLLGTQGTLHATSRHLRRQGRAVQMNRKMIVGPFPYDYLICQIYLDDETGEMQDM